MQIPSFSFLNINFQIVFQTALWAYRNLKVIPKIFKCESANKQTICDQKEQFSEVILNSNTLLQNLPMATPEKFHWGPACDAGSPYSRRHTRILPGRIGRTARSRTRSDNHQRQTFNFSLRRITSSPMLTRMSIFLLMIFSFSGPISFSGDRLM